MSSLCSVTIGHSVISGLLAPTATLREKGCPFIR